MQDLELLAERGLSTEKLKRKFTAEVPNDDIKRLCNRHNDLLLSAYNQNMCEARFYRVIDNILAAAQRNLPYLEARMLAEKGGPPEEIIKRFHTFGLAHMLEPAIDPLTGAQVIVNGVHQLCF